MFQQMPHEVQIAFRDDYVHHDVEGLARGKNRLERRKQSQHTDSDILTRRLMMEKIPGNVELIQSRIKESGHDVLCDQGEIGCTSDFESEAFQVLQFEKIVGVQQGFAPTG
jgi:hypothetical protein